MKLQNEDFKSESDLTGAGGSVSQLLNDTKIYVTGNSINKRLDQAIVDGDIGGGGSGSGTLLALAEATDSQSTPHDTITKASFAVSDFSVINDVSFDDANDEVDINSNGKYLISWTAGCTAPSGASTMRQISLGVYLNGSLVHSSGYVAALSPNSLANAFDSQPYPRASLTFAIELQSGDSLDFRFFQSNNSGNSTNFYNKKISITKLDTGLSSAKYQRKTLSSNFSATGSPSTVSDLTFNNLVIGNTYRIKAIADMEVTANRSGVLEVIHDGNSLALIEAPADNPVANPLPFSKYIETAPFVATATTVTFEFDCIQISSGASATGATLQSAETFSAIEEINFYSSTTDFT